MFDVGVIDLDHVAEPFTTAEPTLSEADLAAIKVAVSLVDVRAVALFRKYREARIISMVIHRKDTAKNMLKSGGWVGAATETLADVVPALRLGIGNGVGRPSILRGDLSEPPPQEFGLLEWRIAGEQRAELERRAGVVDTANLLSRYQITKMQELQIAALAAGEEMTSDEAKAMASRVTRSQPKGAWRG